MGQPEGGLPDPDPEELKQEFPYDDRPVHPKPEDERPLESLSGRGQTEGTPMGLGQGLSWAIIALFGLFILYVLGDYLFSLIR